ncbi:MAG: toprim domain-containing protein [Bacteroidales bacterium]|nr:toprim domain-containing protein [Bacteroidales bacterium]
MYISREDRDFLIQELSVELNAKPDGGRKNLIVPVCPYCGHTGGKFGIYIGQETAKKKLFMAHCFSCGHTTTDINRLLEDIGRSDLKLEDTASFGKLEIPQFANLEEDEIDDELNVVEMPEGWKRCYKNAYLRKRGFTFDDYDYFPVGTTRGLNFKFDNYVVFPIIDSGEIVGYISRHTWSKEKIDEYNRAARLQGKYEIRRYNNSGSKDGENDFVKLLYNYDSVIEDETDTVILCEGVFDVIAITRKLNLYDNHRIAAVATFGKKISEAQIYKLQSKGVRTVVIGYDGDAVSAINTAAKTLNEYFDVYIAYIDDPSQDFDSMDFWDIYDVFSENLKTPIEYGLNIVQL